MDITAKIFIAKVRHKRLFPCINFFCYKSYYLALPLSKLNTLKNNLNINTGGYLSFKETDHSNDQGSCWSWANKVLMQNNIENLVKEVVLLSMPRVMGYIFNPVSFWLCFDKNQQLRAVLCEVNNTFGERHHYLCTCPNNRVIASNDIIKAEKLFHVSPFLKREGNYQFQFSINDNKIAIHINYYDKNNQLQLLTSLIGDLQPLNKKSLLKLQLKQPLITLKTFFLIHWQGLKLAIKKTPYIPKPKQQKPNLSNNK